MISVRKYKNTISWFVYNIINIFTRGTYGVLHFTMNIINAQPGSNGNYNENIIKMT
jgi:hypothetical protein